MVYDRFIAMIAHFTVLEYKLYPVNTRINSELYN